MVLFGLLCSLGIKGGLMLGVTAAEILTSYWSSKRNIAPPPKVYVFNRRVHHGEIGALLAVTSLFLRGTSIPAATTAAILTGIGIGLVKDDYLDIMEWFRLKKKDTDQEQKTTTAFPTHEREVVSGTVKEHDNSDNESGTKPEERSSLISDAIITPDEDKSVIKHIILQPLQQRIRNLVDTYSEEMNQIQLQIKESQKQLQVTNKKS
jgi:hypothetical protein